MVLSYIILETKRDNACKSRFIHTTLFTKAWQIQNIDISVRKEKIYIYKQKINRCKVILTAVKHAFDALIKGIPSEFCHNISSGKTRLVKLKEVGKCFIIY